MADLGDDWWSALAAQVLRDPADRAEERQDLGGFTRTDLLAGRSGLASLRRAAAAHYGVHECGYRLRVLNSVQTVAAKGKALFEATV